MGWGMLLLLAVAVMVHNHSYGSEGWLEEEKRALLDIKESLKLQHASMDASLLASWVSDPYSDCCEWEGVTCDSSLARVIYLSLYNVTGGLEYDGVHVRCISSASLNMSLLLSFKHLNTLNLSYNCFQSLVGIQDNKRKSRFTVLETLDLSYNYGLNRSFMKPLSALTSLKNLIIFNSFINEPFPVQELSVLRNLETLDLSFNLLSMGIGPTFQVLANLSNLVVLLLRRVSIGNEPLPVERLCKMKQLQELDLRGNFLTGSLDVCLGNLTSLKALDLSHNFLNGSIPKSFIAPLASLEYLSLSHNIFQGLFSFSTLANHSNLKVVALGQMYSTLTFEVETENTLWIPLFQLEYLRISHCQVNLPTRTIPTFLLYQHDLKYLDLSNNNFVGTFPTWLLVNNSRLRSCFLDNNHFTGLQLPSNLTQPNHQLANLIIQSNMMQGKLPKNIGYWFPRLEYLDVSRNMFDGDIPASIGEMSHLMTLDLSYNNFSGEIPKQILLGCISLRILRLSNNSLQGRIFQTPMNLRYLVVLMIDNNKFNGALGDRLILSHLNILVISNNNFSGVLSDWIVKSPLNILSASSNNFEGGLPKDLCKDELRYVDLSHNRLFGTIPSCLFMLSLKFIHLQGNSFTSIIDPKQQPRSSSLITLDLRDNKLYGIPKNIYGLSHLKFLFLAGNGLEGQIPSQICQLRQINILDLSRNNFIGSIPSCFRNMSFGKGKIDLSTLNLFEGLVLNNPSYTDYYQYPSFDLGDRQVYYFGQEEVQFLIKSFSHPYKGYALQIISGLDLSSNHLTGEIPHQIGDLPVLIALNLSHNNLNGTIPKSLHNLKEIESLDLSYNNLEGEIPLQLQDLNSLSIFNVSYNNLSGTAPEKGQFGTFDDNSYKGNPLLSWSNSNRRNAMPPSSQTLLNDTQNNESAIEFTSFYWSFGVSYIMILLTLVTILWINPYWRRVWFYYINICLQKSIGQFFEDIFF